MKRAMHRLFCGDSEAKARESHMEEILHMLQQAKATLLPKLLDVPSVKKKGAVSTAAALLRTVPTVGLSDGDAAWVRILNISLKENKSQDETKELVQLMAGKEQAEYLAKHFEHLHVGEMLDSLDIDVLCPMYRAIKLEGVVSTSAKRRRIVGEKTETRKLLAGALIAKLESHLETAESGAATTHSIHSIALRDLYTDELQLGKLVMLIMKSHKVLDMASFSKEVDLTFGGKLLEKISEALRDLRGDPDAGLLEDLSDFAIRIGKRLAKHELVKAAAAFRGAMHFCSHGQGRTLLTDVLLALHDSNKSQGVDKEELLNLLADDGRYSTLVEKWDALEGSPMKTQTWQAEKVERLCEEFEKTGSYQTAAQLHVQLGHVKESCGKKDEAFLCFRQAYKLGDTPQRAGEMGLARLAVEVGRVQDAATEFISPVVGQAQEVQHRIRLCFRLVEDYVNHRLDSIGQRAGPSQARMAECRGSSTPAFDSLLQNFCDSQDSEIGAPVRTTTTPTVPPTVPSTPASAAPGTPLWQAANWTQKAGQLREQHPDRVPTICSPSLDPNRDQTHQIDHFMKPWKFLLKEDASCSDLKRQIQKRLESGLLAGSSPQILGAASEVQAPIQNVELIGRLYGRHKRDDCLHLKFTVDKHEGGFRLELFLP
eukprot:symbB.v1.2.009495.t1/scaffold590.1/size183855/7